MSMISALRQLFQHPLASIAGSDKGSLVPWGPYQESKRKLRLLRQGKIHLDPLTHRYLDTRAKSTHQVISQL